MGRPGFAGRAFIAVLCNTGDRALGLGPSGVNPCRLHACACRRLQVTHTSPQNDLAWCAPVLLRAWITCSLRRSNRRHACGDTAHEAKAGCHRHGCAVAMAPLIKAWRCTQRRFAGRIGSRSLCSSFRLRTSVRSHPCADMPGSREKRTRHAKPPAAGASDRGSARLRLRAGRTTRSLLSCLVPPSKRPSDRRGQGEAAPNRCKPQTKGQNHEHNKQPIHPANQHRRPSRHPRGPPTRCT